MSYVPLYNDYASFIFPILEKVYWNYVAKLDFPRESFSILDAGCGNGNVTVEILNKILPQNCTQIVGVDIDDSMINYCDKQYDDPRIIFKQMDIEAPEIPKKLVGQFQFLFSSYCLMYVKNIRQALANCCTLLKPNGELFFIFLDEPPLYDVYRALNKMNEWKELTEEVANRPTHFNGNDPDLKLRETFKQAGLTVKEHEFVHDFYYESTIWNFLEIIKAMDTLSRKLPLERKEKYLMDFENAFCEVMNIDFSERTRKDKNLNLRYTTIIVHARRTE